MIEIIGRDGEPESYMTAVRSFDHAALAKHPAYARLREALSDLANEASESGDGMKLTGWLDAVRDMALTAPYGDMCSKCTKQCAREHERPADAPCPCGAYSVMYWPHAARRDGDYIRGVYRCTQGHVWTCGYAIDFMRYL